MSSNTRRIFFAHLLCGTIPPTRCYAFKRLIFRWAGLRIGINVRIVSSVRILATGLVSLGKDTFVGHECLIVGGEASVDIGDNVDIGPRVTLVTGTHIIQPKGPNVAGKGLSLPIVIEDGCWICTGATILGGSRIGARSLVMAGAVVKGTFPPESVVGGIPGRIIGNTANSKF